jgi:hypothetical protein
MSQVSPIDMSHLTTLPPLSPLPVPVPAAVLCELCCEDESQGDEEGDDGRNRYWHVDLIFVPILLVEQQRLRTHSVFSILSLF